MPAKLSTSLFAAAAGAALLAAAGAFVHYRTVASASDRLAGIRVEVRKVQASNESLRQSMRNLPEIEERAELFRQRVPAEPGLGALLESLSAQLSGAKVREQEILTKPTVAGRQFARVPVSLRFRGSMESAFGVVRHLETMPRLTRIEKLMIVRPVEQEPLQVDLEFSAFSSTMEGGAAWPEK